MSDKEKFGYTLAWDNVQIQTHCKHQGLDKENTMHEWAMVCAIRNRVPSLHLDRSLNGKQKYQFKLKCTMFPPHKHPQTPYIFLQLCWDENHFSP